MWYKIPKKGNENKRERQTIRMHEIKVNKSLKESQV